METVPVKSRSGLWVALTVGFVVLVLVGGWIGVVRLLRERTPGPTSEPTTRPPVTTTVEIGVDLPFWAVRRGVRGHLQRARALPRATGRARRAVPRHAHRYDNAPDPRSTWDETECKRNAEEHVARSAEVAVIGAFNSSCTKIELPILNGQATTRC